MKIDNVYFTAELEDILDELQSQLAINGYPYLQRGYKRSGNSLQVQCPYHGDGQERHPSYGIRRSDGMGHCFACGQINTLPEFITRCFEKDDMLGNFGRRWLNKNFLSLAVEERKDVELDLERKTGKAVDAGKYVEEDELDSYRYYHPYWEKRGITSEYIIELFDLGYDKQTDSVTFPVRDIEGNCVFVARRSVRTKFFNYPEGVLKPLYGLYELRTATQHQPYQLNITERGHEPGLYNVPDVIVCESMIDALTCWQFGSLAVALNGLGNELQFKQLRKIPCRKLILATDNDEAGIRARKRIRRNVTNKIITEYKLPEGKKDINDLTYEEFLSLPEIF